MPEPDDIALLKQYADENSEAAFAALAGRYVNLVYSAALRHVGNAHAAEEISQAVFIILARKAAQLSQHTVLSGWLYQTARLTAANYLRTEIRRQNREQEAYMQAILNEPEPAAWRQIAPLLDDAMGRLGEKDRNAVVLRFFENKTLSEVGTALGASEDAAKMRVNRALEKLRKIFSKRGVASTSAMIAGAVSANSVQAAPVGLAKTISTVAIAKGAAAGGSTLALVKGALKIMAWTKVNTAIVAGVGVLLVAGTATVTVKKIKEHLADELWRTPKLDSQMVDRLPPEVKILPTKFLPEISHTSGGQNGKVAGIGVPIARILADAYGVSPQRMFFATSGTFDVYEPQARYDFICTLPQHQREKLPLQQDITKQFGLAGRREMRETDVLVLTVKYPNAPDLKPDRNPRGGTWSWSNIGSYACTNLTLSDGLASEFLEGYFDTPIVDETGLKQRFDIDLTWDEPNGQSPTLEAWRHRNLDGVKQALLDQLGLELVPARRSIEMLVVEKAK